MFRATICFAIVCFAQLAFAAPPAIRLDTPNGFSLLQGTSHHHAMALLANYETQQTTSFCGVASAVMVLNSLAIEAPVALMPRPFAYFTQNNFFRAEMNGFVSPTQVQDRGFSLEELAASISSWGPRTEVLRADADNAPVFEHKILQALDEGDFIIANYARSIMGQVGGGHHSPLAAYNVSSKQFLLLDVARYAYPALWVDAATLWRALSAPDAQGRSRGIVIVHSDGAAQSGLSRWVHTPY